MQRVVKNGLNQNQWRVRSPIVFLHGIFHASWCWVVHWLPFFASSVHDFYVVSLLGQVSNFYLVFTSIMEKLGLAKPVLY